MPFKNGRTSGCIQHLNHSADRRLCRLRSAYFVGCAAAALLYTRFRVWCFVVPPIISGITVFVRVIVAPLKRAAPISKPPV